MDKRLELAQNVSKPLENQNNFVNLLKKIGILLFQFFLIQSHKSTFLNLYIFQT